jgi:hypothetical protein
MDSDNDVLNTTQHILDEEEPKFDREAISRPNPVLWHSAIKATMDALRRNRTWDMVDRSTDRKIVDSN